MTVTAPIDVNAPHEGLSSHDDIVIVDDSVSVGAPSQQFLVDPGTRRDPAMLFVYLGVISLLTIIVTAALLAL